MQHIAEQNEYDEVIIIGEQTQQIKINENYTNKSDNTQTLESTETTQCVFVFAYKESIYSKALHSILIRLLYDMVENIQLHSIFYKDNKVGVFELYIQADATSILTFANYLAQSLPLGLDFTFKEVKPLQHDTFILANNESAIHVSKAHNIAATKYVMQDTPNNLLLPNVAELHALLDNANVAYCNIAPFVHIDTCHIPTLEYNITQQQPINGEFIQTLANTLMQQHAITLQRNNTAFTLSMQPPCGNIQYGLPFVLFSTLDVAQSYLRLSEGQKSVLASFEKPFVKTQCKEMFASEFYTHAVFAGLSHDIIVLLLLTYLQDKHEINYLFYSQLSNDLESKDHIPLLCYTDAYPCIDNILRYTYSVAEHIYISHLQTHKNLLSLLTYNHTTHARFIAFLSTQHNTAFLLQNLQHTQSPLQQLLEITFSTDLYTHLRTLYGYTNGDKLIYNFAQANKAIVAKWQLQKEELEALGIATIVPYTNNKKIEYKETNNLLDIYGLIAKILDIDTHLLFEANRCVRDRGPRIDYKLIRQDNTIMLDYARLLRSVMSFQLAGVEKELLCYGVVDSLAEFIGTLASDMLLNYGIQEVFVCGDLLLEQCFLDKIIKAIPKNMHVVFPQIDGTDYLD